jgi:biopolymer transport protein ExbB
MYPKRIIMRWIKFAFCTLFAASSLAASVDFATEDEMFSLDSEIEAILEEEGFDEIVEKPTIISNVPKVVVEELSEEPIGLELDRIAAEDEELISEASPLLDAIKEETTKAIDAIEINLRQVFSGSPVIYSILFLLSTVSICVWLYSMLTIRSVEFLPPTLVKDLRTKLVSNQYDEALDICVKQKHFFCKMLASGILARRHGLNVMIDTMKSEGKRSTVAFWQRINILNEIAVIAPMLGLLGTVLGMFYAFYDLNRSVESVSLLFDGLGISVGTTVAGLIVAILAMILYSIAKYRLVRILANVENEAQTFAALIDTRGPEYLEK